MINVTKTYLPNKKTFLEYIDSIYKNGWLTNNGPLVNKLQHNLEDYLNIKNLLLVSNGTLALQIAYKLLKLKGEVITTPFSFVATTSSLVWENLTPIYSDIDKNTFNINPHNIQDKVNENTSAIVATHVFGNACDIESINKIATNNNLKVIYDAAHAFGINYKESSILLQGDISIVSFHATKLFHTIEGGALIINNDELYEEAKLLINFGIDGPDSIKSIGINAKMNEFQAAMGLSVLKDIPKILKNRKNIYDRYHDELKDFVDFQISTLHGTKNYSYFPILFKTEKELISVVDRLNKESIFPRRYFYPSLNTLPYIKTQNNMPISEDISKRILCIPIYQDLKYNEQSKIITLIQGNILND